MDDSPQPRLAAIVLAAGLSTRMGGPNKLLADYRGKPLVRHALDLAASIDLAQRIVVTGRDADDVSRVVPEGFEIVFNSGFIQGMGTSIAVGAAALRPEIDGVLIFLGDMPDVPTTDVFSVVQAFHSPYEEEPPAPISGVIPAKAGIQLDPSLRRGDGRLAAGPKRSIVVPRHGVERGHPVLFGAAHFGALRALAGDRGARSLILANADAVIEVEASHGVLRDIDTADGFDAAH
jgi:molybdenum cofactor cytidylyltransferase